MWGVLAPAPSDSDAARHGPAPDQPRSGLIAQSWVRLRSRSAACEAPALLDSARPTPAQVGPAPAQVRISFDWHTVLPALDQPRSGMIAQSWVLLVQARSLRGFRCLEERVLGKL